MLISTEFVSGLSDVLYMFSDNPERLSDFANSCSHTQRVSKEWAVTELAKCVDSPETILIIGSWYGTYLVPLIIERLKPKHIILNDVDMFCLQRAKRLFSEYDTDISLLPGDIEQHMQYVSGLDIDVVINTSCEHMIDMSSLSVNNDKCVYLFQSTNTTDDPGHINVVSTSDELVRKSGLVKTLFKGSLKIYEHKTRYMAIGKKSIE